ncbi:MAG: PhoH family protein [Candidatus Omnitrophota bacterium]|nr:PhoH family protein [Candidatus Omnitrophota bacterium]MDZ4241807.1 PhoH family protein [Candidatus Omnitrophota bacterium]
MEKTIKIGNNRDVQVIFGRYDQNLKLIEQQWDVKIYLTDGGLKAIGKQDKLDKIGELMDYLLSIVDSGRDVKRQDVIYALRLSEQDKQFDFKRLAKEKIEVSIKGGLVTPKTKGQIEYVDAIKHYDIVFGIGPAGTGKTYLAMAMAVNALKKGIVRRIILTRPAIEAGENLGFLPGDMVQKVLPYLRPLYDALYDMMEPDQVEQYTEQGIIEVAPLAFMRGRTLNDAFVILDEAQNSTPFQMKMFLTRLGFDSKTVITGDVTQSDLPKGTPIGLVEAQKTLKDIEGIKFVHLTGEDVVRHELVQRIIEAYDRAAKIA